MPRCLIQKGKHRTGDHHRQRAGTGIQVSAARGHLDHIAQGLGVARSTFGEHLRKAQLRLLRNSYPFLKLREHA